MSVAVLTCSHNSGEEFLGQGGTDHLAPRERASGARIRHCGKLLAEASNTCKMAWESVTLFIRLGAAGGRTLKTVFQPSLWPQLCGTALKVAQYPSSNCTIDRSSARKPSYSTHPTPGKKRIEEPSNQEALILSQSSTAWEVLPLTGAASQTAPLSRTSRPGSSVTAALGPVQGSCLPFALTPEWRRTSHRKPREW